MKLKRALQTSNVVVLEDNDVLCRAVVREIASWGATVSSASSIVAALPLIAAPLDLLVSDVRLPDGTAFEVFECAARLDPQPLMLAMSGRASAVEAFELARLGVHAFLAKPFKLPDLERALTSALEQRETRGGGASITTRREIEVQLQHFSANHRLSVQQAELLRLLLTGVSRKELPAALGISENTCKTMIRRLLARCEAERLSDLVRVLTVRSISQPAKRARSQSRDLT